MAQLAGHHRVRVAEHDALRGCGGGRRGGFGSEYERPQPQLQPQPQPQPQQQAAEGTSRRTSRSRSPMTRATRVATTVRTMRGTGEGEGVVTCEASMMVFMPDAQTLLMSVHATLSGNPA